MRCILSGLLLVLLVGCNQSKTGEKDAKRSMTAEQAEMILAMTVGQWKITHSGNASGGDKGSSEEIMLGRWKEKGKSVEAVAQHFGRNQLYLFDLTYDESLGVVVGTTTDSSGETHVMHYTWEKVPDTIHSQLVKPALPEGETFSGTMTRIDDSSFTAVFTRMAGNKVKSSQFSEGKKFGPADDQEFKEFRHLFYSESTMASPRRDGLEVVDSGDREVELPVPEVLEPEPGAESEPEPELVDLPLRKMTAAEASEFMTLLVGHWSGEGTEEPRGNDKVFFRNQWSVRWIDEGKSVEVCGNFKSDRRRYQYRAKRTYDAKLGLLVTEVRNSFGMRYVFHASWDPVTREQRGKRVKPPLPPDVVLQNVRRFTDEKHIYGETNVSQAGEQVFRSRYAFQKVEPEDDKLFEKRLAAFQAAIKQLEEASLTYVPYTTREALPSSEDGQETHVVFQNELERVVKYWYVDGEEQKLYGELKPSERRVQNTFASHVWLITDQQDKPLGYFVASGVSATAKIVPAKPAE